MDWLHNLSLLFFVIAHYPPKHKIMGYHVISEYLRAARSTPTVEPGNCVIMQPTPATWSSNFVIDRIEIMTSDLPLSSHSCTGHYINHVSPVCPLCNMESRPRANFVPEAGLPVSGLSSLSAINMSSSCLRRLTWGPCDHHVRHHTYMHVSRRKEGKKSDCKAS